MIVARLQDLCIDMNKLDESPSVNSAVSVSNHWLTFSFVDNIYLDYYSVSPTS